MVADLLLEAAGLMLIGMVAVYTFLFLLVVLLRLMSQTIQRYFPVKQAEKATKLDTPSSQTVSPAVVAAIGAAIHHYRQKQ
ncbi:MAG: oxaloacetate decarboxylase [Alishewanella sp. 34-51-39]|nr:MAG: oxaloacetate decarboxylase [Alishewanella sp. 34-51-39]